MTLHFLAGYVLGEHGKQSARLAAQSRAPGTASSDALFDIEDRIDRLILIMAAMWDLLKEQGLTEDELQARIAQLDQADGTSDGKFTPQGTICRACGAKVGAGLPACQFCGVEVDAAAAPGVFDGV
ncbi:MAG: hypothetical protein HKN91_14150 [Acidimicrobiia bacterium]|nr:hypothetical protein [Acidimicrobiia bacterium]